MFAPIKLFNFLIPCVISLSSYRLRVEYLENPLTIDVAQPRFSYALQHTQRLQVLNVEIHQQRISSFNCVHINFKSLIKLS